MSRPAAAPDTPTADVLTQKAQAWIEADPDAQTRLEMRQLLAQAQTSGDFTELADRFAGTLRFGTAGLRAVQGAGPNRINTVVTAQAAAALAKFLLADKRGDTVVVGYDGRYNSHKWAVNTARIVSGHGLKALLMPRALPTPLLAYALRQLDAAAGVMVTASHNPRAYNGYKVYLGGKDQGAQINTPDDAAVAKELINAADYAQLPMSDEYTVLGDDIIEAYLADTAAAVSVLMTGIRPGGAADSPLPDLTVCHTAMHGVSDELFQRLMRRTGFTKLIPVQAQQDPDPAFPTLPFPNPEEKGALDLAFETARYHKCDLILANDPDGDRLAVAEPGGRIFTGNEIGALLGWEIARATDRSLAADHLPADNEHGTDFPDRRGALGNSLVSSPCLEKVAERYGLQYAQTPTGFKWVVRIPHIRFGFEEALGYMPYPNQVRDKDGISAALTIAAIAARLKQAGRTLADHLADFKEQFGYFASGQHAIRAESNTEIAAIMQRLRLRPWKQIGPYPVTEYQDLLTANPPVDILRFSLGDAGRVLVRPSGTEPKLKCYIDVTGDNESQAAQRLAEITQACKQAI